MINPALPDQLPPLSTDLIALLDQIVPPRCPELTTPEREIWHYAGQRALVDMLKARLEWHELDANEVSPEETSE